jgi:hypothetical protein
VEPAVLLRVGGVSEMNKLHPACALPLDQSSVTIYDYEPSLADFNAFQIAGFKKLVYRSAAEPRQDAERVDGRSDEIFSEVCHF